MFCIVDAQNVPIVVITAPLSKMRIAVVPVYLDRDKAELARASMIGDGAHSGLRVSPVDIFVPQEPTTPSASHPTMACV